MHSLTQIVNAEVLIDFYHRDSSFYMCTIFGSISYLSLFLMKQVQLVVNFINILRAAFAPIFLCQKITNPNCTYGKASQNTFVQKRRKYNVDEI